jgi:hypothetical protein
VASPDGCSPLDLRGPPLGTSADQPSGVGADRASRVREPELGYLRIVGELRKLGIAVSAASVRNILAKAGMPPAQQRDRQSWQAFLRAHGESILACAFFTVDTVWPRLKGVKTRIRG